MGFTTKIDKLEKAAKAQAEAEFLELIEIDSPSWGEQAIAKVLLRKLKELGIPILAEDTGLNYGRTVELNCANGDYVIKAVGKPIKTI